ncbi:MAG: RNA-binding protein [Spirulinaceae cyanobacterium RM2_2_10]|nr:RNA-binding protein [Spirulinaceae cyanobacterium SM2_1_0]NJO21210.1 RNA-binding protein [Spirulinaceae cyanobacterium RM2_2_10]
MDEQIARGKQWLEQVLNRMGLPVAVTATVPEPDGDGAVWLEIAAAALTPTQIETLLGERGHNIDALQYLANTLLNLGCAPEEQQAFAVELAGYRRRRQAELTEMVEAAIAQVRTTGQEFEMQELSAAERRQVHGLFAEIVDLKTESRGSEPHRRLFICQS